MIRLLLLTLALVGCGAAQTAITLPAVGLVETEELRTHAHERRDAVCRRDFPPAEHAFEAWRSCMDPSYRLDHAVGALDAALRAAQAAYDASGEDGLRARLPALLAAAAHVVEGLLEAQIPVPGALHQILELSRLLQ